MKKVCEDCHKTFECPNNRCTRCPECQEAYRKEYQKEYWNDKPNTHQRDYYRFWRFCTTLTDDEIRTLISKRKNQLKYDNTDGEWLQLRTEIKILCHVYSSREEERKQRNIFWAYEDDERGGY